MTTILDWSRFKVGNAGPERCFEAFSAQLFERWLRRKFPSALTFYTLHGAGGDGGVEAFGGLSGGDVIGLQAKWFDGNLNASRIKQIRSSIDRAIGTFATLRTYVVALRQNLTQGRNQDKKGGVERWDDLVSDLKITYPHLRLMRWDEAGLLEQLAYPGNQEIKALWFEGELTIDMIQRSWEKTRSRLAARYLPDLHCFGRIDAILKEDLWSASWRSHLRRSAGLSRGHLDVATTDLEGFIQLTEGHRPKDLDEAVTRFRATVSELQCHAALLTEVLATGPRLRIPDFPVTEVLGHLNAQLQDFEKKRKGTYTVSHAERALNAVTSARNSLMEIDDAMRSCARPRLISGPAGCGKTHASSATIEKLAKSEQPALLVLAKEYDPSLGATRLLSDVLDLPGWPLARILDGLEALATLNHVQNGPEEDHGFSRFLVVIDGLEESANSPKWAGVLGDIAVELELRPRIHLIATTRPEFLQQIKMPVSVPVTWISEDGNTDLPALLSAYAKKYEVVLDAVPWIGWALRTPIEVRIFAEEFRGQRITAEDGATANLLTLFRRKLERIETEARERAGSGAWSEHLGLVPTVLMVIAELTSTGVAVRVKDIEVVQRTNIIDPEFTAERVRMALMVLLEHGLVDRWIPPDHRLRGPQPEYGLATRHVSDFLLSSAAAQGVMNAIEDGESPAFPDLLRWRHEAAVLFAAQLAERKHFVIDLPWKQPPDALELLHARSLSLIPPSVASERREEISDWLTKTTALNRGLLRGLIVPVARIPAHPLGPRTLDEALMGLPLMKRDPIWSVPEDLEGVGPWQGCFDSVLDDIALSDKVDDWDGLPLVVAWTCSSVVERRRSRAREMLSIWGSHRLDQMVHLLDHFACVDDPQIIDDVSVATFGAAMAAPVGDSALRPLAKMVDELFFAHSPRAWTPSVVVRIAARGVIERAAMQFPGEFDQELTRARPPYSPQTTEWPPIDPSEAARDGHLGGRIVTNDLTWYVAERCFKPFSATATRHRHDRTEQVDSRLRKAMKEGRLCTPPKLIEEIASEREKNELRREEANTRSAKLFEQIRKWHQEGAGSGNPENMTENDLLEWALQQKDMQVSQKTAEAQKPEYSDRFRIFLAHAAAVTGIENPSLGGIRNGMIAHLVQTWGYSSEAFSHHAWDKPAEVVDDAIAKRHGWGASHGSRSEVCQFREKYVWAAVDRIAGELADRLPAWSKDNGDWAMLRNLDDLGNGFPDPLPHSLEGDGRDMDPTEAWIPNGILPELFTDETSLAHRAEKWLTEGDLPDPRTFICGSAECWPSAALLSFFHFRRGHQCCIDQFVEARAFGVHPANILFLRRDAQFVADNLHDRGAWVEEGVYVSPALATWAPWLTWRGIDQGYASFDTAGSTHHVELRATVGSTTARFEGEWPQEQTVWMPSPPLSQELGVVGMLGGRWLRKYVDRYENVAAVERDVPPKSLSFDHHYLAVDMATFIAALARQGLIPVWAVRVLREATPALFMCGSSSFEVREGLNHRRRDTSWLVVGNPMEGDPEVIRISDVQEPWKTRGSD